MGNKSENKEQVTAEKVLLTFVGMPGAGKTEAAQYLNHKGIPFVRFGDVTDQGVTDLDLPLTPDNERMVREKLRQELGMAAYAIKAKPRIDDLLRENKIVALDGLYSWEEYKLLKGEFPGLILIHIFAEPIKRYERLSRRPVRPLSFEKARERDIAEIENLNKGGPIAIADYLIDNDSDNIEDLYHKIDNLLLRLRVGTAS